MLYLVIQANLRAKNHQVSQLINRGTQELKRSLTTDHYGNSQWCRTHQVNSP